MVDASESVTTDPDWWARGLGAGGALLGALSLGINRFDNRWKRRHITMGALRDSIEDLAVPVENWRDPQVVQSLFSTTSGALLEGIRRELPRVPDWGYRRRVHRFVDVVAAVRGEPFATDSATGAPVLTQTQRGKLRSAEQLVGRIRKRMDAAARHGSA
jgi:hypothetical protein